MSDAEQVVKVQPDAVKKGGYAFIRGFPCRLVDLEVLPKATANGNKRLRMRGPHVFTGKIYGGGGHATTIPHGTNDTTGQACSRGDPARDIWGIFAIYLHACRHLGTM